MIQTDLLVLGGEGLTPLLLLYGVTLEQARVLAQGYTARYDLPDSLLFALEHDNPTNKNWVRQSPGLTVKFPASPSGHYLHTAVELVRVTD